MRKGLLYLCQLYKHVKPQADLFSGLSISTSLYDEISKSSKAIESGNAAYFVDGLPRSELYRIALAYPSLTAFDIETTGLSLYYDEITMVGLSIGNDYFVWKQGDDINPIKSALGQAKSLVTFNGTAFDVKFLENEFPTLPKAHLDLRFLGLTNGLRGSQKEIETHLGLKRPET